MLGDNRFVQLAPYCSGYERLPEHMALAGVRPAPNYWDLPVALLPDHSKHHHGPLAQQQQQQQQHGSGGGASASGGSPASSRGGSPSASGLSVNLFGSPTDSMQTSQQQQHQLPHTHHLTASPASPSSIGMEASSSNAAVGSTASGPAGGSPAADHAAVGSPVPGTPAAVTLLPPPKLVPFFIPFRGGAGPMCGGPARVAPARPSPSAAAPGGASGASTSAAASPTDSLSSFFAVGEGGHASFPASPFALPEVYRAAWEERTRGAMEIKAAVKAVRV